MNPFASMAIRLFGICSAIMLSSPTLHAQACACAKTEVRVHCQHGLAATDLTVTFGGVTISPFYAPQSMEREKAYPIEVSINQTQAATTNGVNQMAAVVGPSAEKVLLTFPHCDVEYTEDEIPTWDSVWIRRSSVTSYVSISNSAKIWIRLTDAASDHAAGTTTSGSGPGTTACGGSAVINVEPAKSGTAVDADATLPATLGENFHIVPVPAGVSMEIPMGFASTKYGFRSAGRIAAYGQVSPSFASPGNFAFNRIKEMDWKVTPGDPPPGFTGRIDAIQHTVPQGVFRIRGWNAATQTAVDVRDVNGVYASGTLIEVYYPHSDSEMPVQHSFYRIEPSGNGVKIVQSNHGFLRERVIVAVTADLITDTEGIRTTQFQTTPGLAPNEFVVLRTVTENGQQVSMESETYGLVDFEMLPKHRSDGALTTDTTYYFPGRIFEITRTDGSWSRFEYDPDDWQKVTEFGTWLSNGSASGQAIRTETIDTFYEQSTKTELMIDTQSPRMLSSSSTKLDSLTGITEHLQSGASGTEEYSVGYDQAGSFVKGVNIEFNPRWAGRPRLVWDKYGKATRFTYEEGVFNGQTFSANVPFDQIPDGTDVRIKKETGKVTLPIGASDPDSHFSVVPGHSTVEETIVGAPGVIRHTVDSVTTNFVYEPTGQRRLTSRIVNGFTVAQTQYVSAYVTREFGEDGSYVETQIDSLGRVIRSTTSGDATVPSVTTEYFPVGLTTTTKVNGRKVSVETRNLAGKVTVEDATGAKTVTEPSADGKTVTQTAPGQVTTISTNHSDGRAESITGSGVIPRYYEYEVGLTTVATTTLMGSLTSPRWFTSWTDTGTVVFDSRPNPDGNVANPVQTSYRYVTGVSAPVEVVTTASPAQVSFDPEAEIESELLMPFMMGNYSLSGLSTDGDGPEVSSSDRVSSAERSIVTANGAVSRRTVEKIYHTIGSDVHYTRTTVEALAPVAFGNGARWTSTVTTGNTTVTTTRDVFFTSSTTVISVDDTSTAASPDSVTITRHGKTVSSAVYGGNQPETMVYDTSGRLWKHTSATGAVTTYSYNDVTGQLDSVRDHEGKTTRSVYHPPTHQNAGLLWKTINPENETAETLYNKRGQVVETLGNGTYRIKYDYDEYGAMIKMWTYRSAGSAGDLTQWVYYPATGLLHKKIDALGRETEYTYYPSGKIKSRKWARTADSSSERIVTNYVYGNGFNDLTGITYTDGTPSVSIVPDRLGRPFTITDASGVRTHQYHATTGALDLVSYGAGGPLAGLAVDYTFHSDVNGDNSLRPSGYSVSGGGPASVWTYDNEGRLKTVGSGGFVHTHTYVPGTGVMATMETKSGTPKVLTRSLTHDKMLRLRGIETKNGANVVLSRHGYSLDGAGRRTKATRENGQRWDYQYDEIGQVEDAKKKFPGSGGTIPGHDFQYTYDGIGNRLSAVEGGTGTATTGTGVTYVPNALNQYEAITTQGGRFILGEAPVANPVTVNDGVSVTTADRAGGLGFFWKQLGGTNATSPLWSNDTVASSGSPDISGRTWTPRSGYFPSYDPDGNLKSDGRWDYTWNAENRLTRMTTTTAAANAGVPRQQLEFVYDSQGRRVAKNVSTSTNGTTWTFASSMRFLYDGWNLIAEYSAPGAASTTLTLQASHTWGIDLSGTMQGAGGVGGLLSSTVLNVGSYTPCFPAYDGNGNISAWIDAAGGVLERMDYSPFGRLVTCQKIGSSGLLSRLSFGFSTKFTDAESGLLYYGYRFYDPVMGRWPSRDPIGENGGVNLFGFVGNSPISLFDVLGKRPPPTEEEGKTGLAKATESMHKICDSCCPSKKCKPTKDECKKEADEIVKALLKVWDDNYDNGKDTSSDSVGGYLCWDWSRAFEGAVDSLKLKSWKADERMSQTKAPEDGEYPVHYWIKLTACKENGDNCTVVIDDGWLNPPEFIHSKPFPSDKNRWGRDKRNPPPGYKYTNPPIKYPKTEK